MSLTGVICWFEESSEPSLSSSYLLQQIGIEYLLCTRHCARYFFFFFRFFLIQIWIFGYVLPTEKKQQHRKHKRMKNKKGKNPLWKVLLLLTPYTFGTTAGLRNAIYRQQRTRQTLSLPSGSLLSYLPGMEPWDHGVKSFYWRENEPWGWVSYPGSQSSKCQRGIWEVGSFHS